MTTLFLTALLFWAGQPQPDNSPLVQALHRGDFGAVDAALQSATDTARDVEAVQRELTNPAPSVRQLAAYALSQIDPERAKQSIPVLIEALQHPEPRVRARLALALAKIGPAARAAIPSLIEQLKDEDPRCRAGAAWALGTLGAEANGAVLALASLLKDPEMQVRVTTAMALGQLGPRAKEVGPALRVAQRTDASAEVRTAAATALEEVDPPMALVLAALRDADHQRRLWAVSRLIEDGNAARSAIAPLAQLVTQDADAGVRAGAALALGKVGPDARTAGAALVVALKDFSPRVRGTAALALGLLGPGVENAGPALAHALGDEDSTVVDAAGTGLCNLGPAAESAMPILVGLLGSKNVQQRKRAVNILARIGGSARPAATPLVQALSDDDTEVRHEACRALVSIGPQGTAPIPALIEALGHHQDPLDGLVRAWACLSLAEMGSAAEAALSPLLDALRDKETNVRIVAAFALTRIGPAAVPALVGTLDHLEPEVRAGSARALGGMGLGAKRSIDALVKAMRDEDARVRLAAVVALGSIARGMQLQGDPHDFPMLERVHKAIQEARAPSSGPEAEQWQVGESQVRSAVAGLQQATQARLIDRVLHNPWLVSLSIIVVYLAVLVTALALLLWRWPLLLLSFGDKLRFLPRIQVPIGFGTVSLSARELLLLPLVEHHPRVLDAWIDRHREPYRRGFEAILTVQDRKLYISVPIAVDGQPVSIPVARDLGQAFAGQRGCLLICGEGGAGKTSLACWLARWAMEDDPAARLCDHVLLPVLIESGSQTLGAKDGPGHAALLEAVRGQMQALLPQVPALSEESILALLRRRRILVIVDQPGHAEDAALGAIHPGHADFPAHALVVVSRRETALEGVPRTVLVPLMIEGTRVLSFLEAYMTQRGRRPLLDRPECLEACKQLALLIDHRQIAPRFARQFADLLIERAEAPASNHPPITLPELMRGHVFQLNSTVPIERRQSAPEVFEDAARLAWECIRRKLKPESVSRSSALDALGGADARDRLAYLEQELKLVRTLGPQQDRISFELDPLAETLAALAVVERSGSEMKSWQTFLTEYPSLGGRTGDHVTGFWLALCDCCQQRAECGFVLMMLDRGQSQAA